MKMQIQGAKRIKNHTEDFSIHINKLCSRKQHKMT